MALLRPRSPDDALSQGAAPPLWDDAVTPCAVPLPSPDSRYGSGRVPRPWGRPHSRRLIAVLIPGPAAASSSGADRRIPGGGSFLSLPAAVFALHPVPPGRVV